MKSAVIGILTLVAATALCPAASTVVAQYKMGELEIAGGASVGDTVNIR